MTQSNLEIIQIALENDFLNMKKLVENVYSAATESYINFEKDAKNPETCDPQYKRDLVYVPIAREEGAQVDEETLTQEFITLRISLRHLCFCLITNSIELDEQAEPLSLSIVMDMQPIIDKYIEEVFSTSFLTTGTDCAYYGVSVMPIFQRFITDPSDWKGTQMEELYEKAANTITE